ncbi:MAG: cupin domain-containing protein [Armatimonadota bacterium]|nr:cupin domain-containing protein [Armatimonadota bacterium]
MTRYVFSTTDTIRYRFPTHTNDLVMDRADAETSEVFIVVLEPGEAPPLHVHHDMEQIFYVLEGAGVLEIGQPPRQFAVGPGDVIRIPPHTPHRVICRSPRPVRYLSVDAFLGGRPDTEPTWESHVRALCQAFGWEFDRVRVDDRSNR